MTAMGKTQKRNALAAELLRLQGIMRDSDAHAMKCQKLGIAFSETYPDEYEAYVQARDAYNATEQEMSELEQVQVEEDFTYHPVERR